MILIKEIHSEVMVYAPQIGFNYRCDLTVEKDGRIERNTYSFRDADWQEIKRQGYFMYE